MTSFETLRREWFGNVRGDLLAGLVVALALIRRSSDIQLIVRAA